MKFSLFRQAGWQRITAALQQRPDYWLQLSLLLPAAFTRLWRLDTPATMVFDEVYFPVFANNYLERTAFFDAHPPLGKYLIALGIRFFGNVPLGWRIMEALFGIAVILLIYRLTLQLFADRRAAMLAGLFAIADGVLLVESRTGLINIFAVFFCLLAYRLFLQAGSEQPRQPRWLYLLGSGMAMGAATAVKWIGAASFAVIFLIFLLAKARQQWPCLAARLPGSGLLSRLAGIHPDVFLLTCVVMPALVYSASFLIHLQQNDQHHFFELHRQMFGYHAHLQAGHGYASPWWSWPLLQRPVNYFWQVAATGQTTTILLLGNPALWWLALAGVGAGLWQAVVHRHFGAAFAVLALALHYLPFALISRASFLYHFMGALPFSIMLLAALLVRLWQRGGLPRELAAMAVLAVVLCALYFFPLWTAQPLPLGAFYQRMWLRSWI
ncbi:MAG: phospholipid carrier-dependent glycosyltransferase [candidate division KSB1 bacterium]|nr:phospholipid carrier-dependent glycosyltransferase [candidate division KSB1 bacterium]MDZ7275290.1 phospholipid carrier-dependent glycosyltransferase [candidate division KSB1 bacterium]MDZ7287458.1 phospholipid carrier-dependent glycosyltransferase [candidate division KSB1 bacterium]MDZ7299572.1 phospholipid carrier-dependent glycosyltransferase [candidate division KSB1 bacterium]MDZ7307324.1 phospholipid carrier-dependent glycosyltransferase [candidate division KSB1 bacterium]